MAEAAEAPAAAPRVDAPANDFLVVCDTQDVWSTGGALLKEIAKARRNNRITVGDVPCADGARAAKHEDVLPGLQRIGKNPKNARAYLSFTSQAAQENAVAALHEAKVKNKMWHAWAGNENHANYFSFVASEKQAHGKRKLGAMGGENDGADAKRAKAASIHDFVEPLYNVPYETQLAKKTANLEGVVKDIKAVIGKVWWGGRQPPPALQQALSTFHGVVPSPTQLGYRNKVEFTIGMGKDGKTPCVGFMFGKTAESLGWVEPATDVKVVSDRTKRVAAKFAAFLATSPHAPYDKFARTGVWRALLVREGVPKGAAERTGQPTSLLVDVSVNATTESEVFQSIAADLKTLFRTAEEAADEDKVEVASLSLTENQSMNNFCDEKAPTVIVKGAVEIEDRALGKKFRVSARSFFQVNSLGNEVLLNQIAKFANLTKDTLLVDLCCGTGTIGISLADRVKAVIGIDCVASAIDDARQNAAANGVGNAVYHCGKAEDLVHSVLGPHKDNPHLLAIVDPPRGGLHGKVLEFLRNSGIPRFVYVSCKQSSLVQNCEKLTQPCSNRIHGAPFAPVEAVGVDLFPQCDMQEMIILFERVQAAAAPEEETP
eukprot:TRINITY_DN18124_c0_g1_i1.p1 TRINITY_DN18124_c0_g1~~TRINITY_DN18124_c0_g1_i1.p1  ORF type:complete len:602 (+),score=221.69 TRINITY_DN18124_c0_g1_i1:53-1858(+)